MLKSIFEILSPLLKLISQWQEDREKRRLEKLGQFKALYELHKKDRANRASLIESTESLLREKDKLP